MRWSLKVRCITSVSGLLFSPKNFEVVIINISIINNGLHDYLYVKEVAYDNVSPDSSVPLSMQLFPARKTHLLSIKQLRDKVSD